MKIQYRYLCLLTFLVAIAIYSGENGAIPASFEGFGIKVPFYDDKGELSHILHAEKASRQESHPKLERVQIVFFENGDRNKPIGKILTPKAVYDPIHKAIEGTDFIKLESPHCQAAGKGFYADLDSKQMIIKRDCVATLSGLEVRSEQAIFKFQNADEEPHNRMGILKSLTAKGNVVVLNHENTTYDFDRVNTDIAIYEAVTSTITMPDELQILKDKTSVIMSKLVIKTKETEQDD